MIINTEWAEFDNERTILPITQYNLQLDAETNSPGESIFGKLISGTLPPLKRLSRKRPRPRPRLKPRPPRTARLCSQLSPPGSACPIPVEVPYNVFWLRYYYRVWQVEQEEEQRKQIVKDVATTPQTEEELFNWDMEEEDDPASLSASLATPLAGSLNASTITGGDGDELVHVSQTPSTEPSLVSPVTGSSRAGDTDEENDSWGTETEEARRDEVVQRGSASLEVDKDKDWVKAGEEGFEIVTEKGKKKAEATAAAGSSGSASGKPREGGKDRERTAGNEEDDWSDWDAEGDVVREITVHDVLDLHSTRLHERSQIFGILVDLLSSS
ncbi:hypothetical protein BC937DRAFT_87512 [Endogone sp. FLAS-F59071]|nr:hypothetical protein BC937DRAFT_87512 [Endogone sp. FLAS-F59071]|eukprot:RUS19423.1 hypothetical protein BC937DRAFT_87512 [Endogone sp. FLAS-F59071]